jgi:hypothetical protein
MIMADIPALKADLKTKLAAAEKAQQKLIDAQSAAGLSAPQHFWSWSEVKELLVEERSGWIELWKATANPHPDSAFVKLAKSAKTQPHIAKLYVDTPAKGKK